jgi:plasmid stability protein
VILFHVTLSTIDKRGVKMATLHIRNVPDELYEQLRQRAEAQHRSLSAELITLLENVLSHPQRTPAEILASIRHRRYFKPGAVGAPDSTSLLQQDRER